MKPPYHSDDPSRPTELNEAEAALQELAVIQAEIDDIERKSSIIEQELHQKGVRGVSYSLRNRQP